MRPVLQNQPQIGSVSQALLESLKTMLAAITAGWNQQHTGDGAHTAVTATSLIVTPGTTALGKLNLSSVTYVDDGLGGGVKHDVSVAGLSTCSCLRVLGESSPLQITGIDATGRTRGDLLLVLNCDYTLDPQDVWLMMENTGSMAVNRFAETTASPTSVGGAVIINGGRGVFLIYDYQEQELNSSPVGARWRVLDPAV